VAAAILQRYRSDLPLRYWKPIQTGADRDDDTMVVARLAGCRAEELLLTGVRLSRPVSPHLAARLEGYPLAIDSLLSSVAAELRRSCWIVEGAGGALVPLNDSETMVDLMVRLALPAVVASRSTIGTINHTVLTVEALRRRGLEVAGVVLVGAKEPDNRAAIEHHGRVPVLGEMPLFEPLTPDRLGAWAAAEFDPARRLLEVLR
jgi:dethiobiotin synthase